MLVFEAIVTTEDYYGRHNAAPMGLWRDSDRHECVTLRPYQNTHTYQNLIAYGGGVINFSADGALYVYTALGDPRLYGVEAERVPGLILSEVPAYWEIEVEAVDSTEERARLGCRIVKRGARAPFCGINRASAALLEAAVHASRLFLLDIQFLEAEIERARSLVEKVGGMREKQALHYLINYVRTNQRKVGDG